MTSFQISLTEAAPERALALIVPVPPETHFQSLRSMRLPLDQNETMLVMDQNSIQQAFVLSVDGTNFANKLVAEYQVDIVGGTLNQHHFRKCALGSLELSEDVIACNKRIFSGATNCDQHLILRNIIDYLANEFDYIHHDDELNRGALSCNHLRGDCLDINTALMKLLALNDIESAYYIGVYFESNAESIVDDWHCWVTTQLDEVEDWDIAHHIKRRLGKVMNRLNPVPGTRVALSSGRDLSFVISESYWQLSHFGAPIWLLPNGESRQAAFIAQQN